MITPEYIRNFCIIAHIDHGKSTLADRFLEITGTISKEKMQSQVLDDMDLERERGITIKSHPIRMKYSANDGNTYQFNLIDTPGHVDFSYEVSRSLAACEGAILVVDASQGIEAQTLTNIFLAMENDLTIIPVMNKVDLPSARPEEIASQISDLLGCDKDSILSCSAKTGEGIKPILEQVITEIPPPKDRSGQPLQSLVFDSIFDSFRGAVAYVRVFEGELAKGQQIKFFSTGKVFEVDEVGYFLMGRVPVKSLKTGEVGYIIASIKTVSDINIGDTITTRINGTEKPIPGYREVKPMVFSGIYPVDKGDYEDLRSALEKLRLNDSSISYEPETSTALGFGFRAGFLGLLHMEIIQERLLREFNVNIITTVPNVQYQVYLKNDTQVEIDSPARLPAQQDVDYISEPISKVQIITPTDYVGPIMKLCEEKRGKLKNMEYLEITRVCLNYDIPLAELIIDFFDKLKSCSRGYASMDYETGGYERNDLIKLDILINGSPVDAFSSIIHREKAFTFGQMLTTKLKELIPRQNYEVAIQAAIGTKVIARTTVKAYRKDVTAKCYGGDISRKRKLLEKQKEGKKRMKQVGNIEIPQEAFLAVLSRE
ncbi:translation elongation factor 4 [Chitinispirillales bacterium ANBcel5]|uniref:translation elongation factor 4 n=1 Tax=Cellulosispirillum alkaliphilum TaxID=3039283 RepID=UPI002A550BF5|nr:translation elongation factor 4 [Chitinispirillales bacterium ANBcel5]